MRDRDPVLGFQAIQLLGQQDIFGEPMPYQLADVPNVPDAIKNGVGIDEAHANAVGYIHGNCGSCHAPGKNQLVLRAEINAAQQPIMSQIGSCYEESFDVDRREVHDEFDAVLKVTAPIAPERPDNSYIYARMSTRADGVKMPRIASKKVDPRGMELVRNWITSLTSAEYTRCPEPTTPVEPTEPVGEEPFEEEPVGEEPVGEEPVGEEPFEEPSEGEEPFEEPSEGEEPFEGDPFGSARNSSSSRSH